MAASKCAVPVSLGSPRFRAGEYGSLLITDAVFPAGHTIEKHYHERTVIGLTLSGNWNSILGSHRLDNVAGMLHVEPAGESHTNHFGLQEAHVVIIQPSPANRALTQGFKSFLETASQVRIGPPGCLIARRLRHELLNPDELTCLAIESLFLDLLVSGSRTFRSRQQHAPSWLDRALDCMHAQFLERITVGDLSKVLDVSPDHFNREFSRRFHMGPAEYLRRLRLNWAAEQLRDATNSLSEIASAAGFADQSHFTRRFRLQFGTTPAAFRTACLTTRKTMRTTIARSENPPPGAVGG